MLTNFPCVISEIQPIALFWCIYQYICETPRANCSLARQLARCVNAISRRIESVNAMNYLFPVIQTEMLGVNEESCWFGNRKIKSEDKSKEV